MIKVLVSNDDGISSNGIKALVKALERLADVYVVAPASQRSATGQGMTLHHPVNISETVFPGAKRAYAVDGLPTDCVKFGLQKLKEMKISVDYVISGINLGANAGTDVHYSGTVAIATEAAMSGYRAIALSVGSHIATHFEYLCDMLPEIIGMSKELPLGTVLNINSPDLPKWEIKGVKMTGMGPRSFDDHFESVKGEEDMYEYDGHLKDFGENTEAYDLVALCKGFVTVTPILVDIADYRTLRYMKRVTNDSVICMFIDFQEKLVPVMSKSKRMMKNAIKMARCAKALELPILVTQQYTRGIGSTVPELQKELGTFDVIEKLEFNCFDTPGFEDRTESWFGRTVVLSGIEAHICIQQTALAFLDRGYDVVVLKDCCSSRKEEDFDTAMELLAAKGCTVTTYEAFVYDILGSSKHTCFKEIAAIVKE